MNFLIISEEKFNQIMDKLNELTAQSDDSLMDELSQFISNEELAKKLNLSTRTLMRYRNSGKLKFYQIERKIYYKVSEILEFIHKHGVEPFNNK